MSLTTGIHITAAASQFSDATQEAELRLTELDATAHANESPSSTNTRFIYRFMYEGKMCVRILRSDQADRIKQIFHTINQKLPNPESEDGSSLKGRVTAINFVADSIQIEKSDGNKDSISFSSLEGDNQWYELAVNELVEIVRGKMVGSSSLEDRTFHRSDAPKGAEVTNFCSIPGRVFGSTPIDLSHVGCGKEQKLDKYLAQRYKYLAQRWNTSTDSRLPEDVFTSELETIKQEMQKQYRNQPLTREMEKECKIEARSRAVAVELLRTGSDEARIALFMQLTIENNLPCNTSLNLRTPLDQAMARESLKLQGLDSLQSVKLNDDSSIKGESSLTEEENDAIDERFKAALASGGVTERSRDDSEMPAVWQGQGASSGGGGLFSGLWNRMSSGRSDPKAANWLTTAKDAIVEGLKGKAMSEDVDSADGFELADLPDLRSNLATDLRGSIVGLENTDVAKNKWTEFVIKGQAEEPLLQAMQDAASRGEGALKEFLTDALDDGSSELDLDLLIQYLNRAVKEAPKQPSKFHPDSLVAVLKEAWGRGLGPSETIRDPDIADSKQVKALLSREGFHLKEGASGFGGDKS